MIPKLSTTSVKGAENSHKDSWQIKWWQKQLPKLAETDTVVAWLGLWQKIINSNPISKLILERMVEIMSLPKDDSPFQAVAVGI